MGQGTHSGQTRQQSTSRRRRYQSAKALCVTLTPGKQVAKLGGSGFSIINNP
jgi:hypothetical protein